MSKVTKTQVDIAIPVPSFQIDGQVVEVLPGSGLAALRTNSADDLTVSRGTKGVHFEELRVGDRVNCQVGINNSRVLYAHQQTQPMPAPASAQSHDGLDAHSQAQPLSASSGSFDSNQHAMTREGFIAEYCRRWGVAWADISKYRVVLPSNNAMGWTMASTDDDGNAQTLQGPLESPSG